MQNAQKIANFMSKNLLYLGQMQQFCNKMLDLGVR